MWSKGRPLPAQGCRGSRPGSGQRQLVGPWRGRGPVGEEGVQRGGGAWGKEGPRPGGDRLGGGGGGLPRPGAPSVASVPPRLRRWRGSPGSRSPVLGLLGPCQALLFHRSCPRTWMSSCCRPRPTTPRTCTSWESRRAAPTGRASRPGPAGVSRSPVHLGNSGTRWASGAKAAAAQGPCVGGHGPRPSVG